ncbi:hypothetical protein D3C76_1380150 [compost metagenome]
MQLRLRGGRAQHGTSVTQDDALNLRLARHFQVGAATVPETVPRVACGVGNGVQPCIHFRIDLRNHCRQQALLVAEMVIKGAAGEVGLGSQVIHRCFTVTTRAEDLACSLQQGGAGLLHVGLGASDHRSSW